MNVAIWYKQLFSQIVDLLVFFLVFFISIQIFYKDVTLISNTLGTGLGVYIGGYHQFIDFILDSNKDINLAVNALLDGIIVAFIYFLIEILTSGKSLGKLIFGLQIVNLKSEKIGFFRTLFRVLLRLIPFSLFSYLGKYPIGFNNLIMQTRVIDTVSTKEKIVLFNKFIFSKLPNFNFNMKVSLIEIGLIGLLIIASLDLPYSYYTLLRLALMGGFIILAEGEVKLNKNLRIIFWCLALLFQPFFKVHLDKESWKILDISLAIFLLWVFEFLSLIKIYKNNSDLSFGSLVDSSKKSTIVLKLFITLVIVLFSFYE